jgi:hypothetical protein
MTYLRGLYVIWGLMYTYGVYSFGRIKGYDEHQEKKREEAFGNKCVNTEREIKRA